MPAILVDTGPLYAMADRDDDWPGRMVRFLRRSRDELVIPVTVLPEAAYLLGAHLGPEGEQKLVRSVVNGEFALEELTIQDLRRTLELLIRYADARIGFVDATVVDPCRATHGVSHHLASPPIHSANTVPGANEKDG